MGTSLQRLDQVAKPDSFDDQLAAAQVAAIESSATDFGEFIEGILSQLKRIIHGDESGDWHDDPVTVFGSDASLLALLRSMYRPVACLVTDTASDFTCIRGDRVNGKWRVEKADPENEAKMPAVGVLVSKSTPTVGIIQVTGPCGLFSGLDFTKSAYHLGASGIQSGLPVVGGGGYVMVQQIGKPVASDVLWLTNDTRMVKRRA